MLLALDISTSCTGFCLFDENDFVVTGYINLGKHKGLFAKAQEVKNRISALSKDYQIDNVVIEENLQAFRPGFSSAKTLLTLASFNGIVSYICQDQFGIKPEYIGASTARKLNGIKVPRGEKAKKVILQHVLDNESDFVVEYTKQENPKPGSYDRADSLIIARAGYNLWKEKNSNS